MMEEQSPWKETRVSMGHQSAPSDAKESTPLAPFRLMFVSDLAPHRRDVDWQTRSHILNVDKYNFTELIQSLLPSVEVTVPNKLDSKTSSVSFQLTFGSINSFTPSGVIELVPRLKQLDKVCKLLRKVADGGVSSPEFRGSLIEIGVEDAWADSLYQELIRKPSQRSESPAASREESGSTGLDRIFSLIDTDGKNDGPPPPSPVDRAMSAFVGAVSDDASDFDLGGARRIAKQIEDVLVDQVNEILHDKAYQRLESSWLGLKFLVDNLDFRKGVKLEVLAARKDNVNEAVHYQVLLPNHESPPAVPLTAIVLDYIYGDEPIDIERLGDLADSGMHMQVPLIASAADRIWSVRDSSGKQKVPMLAQHLQGPEFIAWNTLREMPSARYLALALPGFLLRSPFGEAKRDREFKAFTEKVSEDGSGYLWGRASVPVGAAMAASYVETGWATHFEGAGSPASFSEMPIWNVDDTNIPLSCWIPSYKVNECAENGFAVLACRSNSDTMFVSRANTLSKVPAYKDDSALAEAKQNVRLASQVVANRLGNALNLAFGKLERGNSADTIRTIVASHMKAALQPVGDALDEDAIRVEIADSPSGADAYGIGVRVAVPPRIAGAELNVAMGFEYPKG